MRPPFIFIQTNAPKIPEMYIDGKQYYIHRVLALEEKHLTNGFSVHHTCNNKKCLNPDHLKLVTYSENSKAHRDTINRYCLDAARGKELDNTIQLFMEKSGISKKSQAIKELVNLGLNYYFFVNQ
jgi:hypothetical protein